MKRFFLTVIFTLLSLAILGSFALWLVLSAWVPNKGKALLIQEAERRWPITLSIGTVRYNVFQGFVLSDVRVAQRASGEVWAVVPAMNVQPDWPTLAVARTLAFRGRIRAESPVGASFSVSGRYHLDRRTASISAQSDAIPLERFGGMLAAHLPPQLSAGSIRPQLHLTVVPGEPMTITGRLTGAGLVWTGKPWTLKGTLTLNGSARPPVTSPDGARGRWTVAAVASLDDAVLTGVPAVGSVSRLSGTGQLSDARLEAVTLTGDALGSRWQLDGGVEFTRPSMEARITTRAELAALAGAFPALAEWRIGGGAGVDAVCRGPLAPKPWLDCQVRAVPERAVVDGPALPEPVTDIGGRLSYDVPAAALEVHELQGRLRQHPLKTSGRIRFGRAGELALAASGTVPLELMSRWLPPQSPVSGLAGEAACDVTIDGPMRAPRVLGRAQLRDASAHVARPAMALGHVNGLVELTRNRLTFTDLDLEFNGQPVTVGAEIAPPPFGRQPLLNVSATVATAQATARAKARVTPDDVLIDAGELVFAGSRLQALGTVSRDPARASRVNVTGRVQIEELPHLPFVSLPQIDQWKLSGVADVEGQFQGRWAQWQSATVRLRAASPRLVVLDLPVEQVSLSAEQRDRVLRASVPAVMIAGGRGVGELVIEYLPAHHRYLVQADVTGLDLQRLAAVVPAWRQKTMKGQATGRLLLSGAWEERASWRGEGWLNASGEHLGDIPLLDKVFQRAVLGSLADFMGLEPLRRAKITKASLTWKLDDQQVRTEDLRLAGDVGVGAVVIYLRGTVGLDQRLNLAVQPEFSEQVLSQSRALSGIGQVLTSAGLLQQLMTYFRYRIVGTLSEPKVERQFTIEDAVRQALGGGAVNFLHNLFGGAQQPQ